MTEKRNINVGTPGHCDHNKALGLSDVEGVVIWRTPNGEVPDGALLVEVDTNRGSDVALVVIDDEDLSTLKDIENGDVWTAWTWQDVSRYAYLDDILPAR